MLFVLQEQIKHILRNSAMISFLEQNCWKKNRVPKMRNSIEIFEKKIWKKKVELTNSKYALVKIYLLVLSLLFSLFEGLLLCVVFFNTLRGLCLPRYFSCDFYTFSLIIRRPNSLSCWGKLLKTISSISLTRESLHYRQQPTVIETHQHQSKIG